MGSDFSPYIPLLSVLIQGAFSVNGTSKEPVKFHIILEMTSHRLSVVKFEINITKSAVSISKTMSYYRKGSAAPEDGQINSIFLCLNGRHICVDH